MGRENVSVVMHSTAEETHGDPRGSEHCRGGRVGERSWDRGKPSQRMGILCAVGGLVGNHEDMDNLEVLADVQLLGTGRPPAADGLDGGRGDTRYSKSGCSTRTHGVAANVDPRCP